MSGFSFPPPPPPPPSNTNLQSNHHDPAATRGGRGRARASRASQGRTPGGAGTYRNDLNISGSFGLRDAPVVTSTLLATDRGSQRTGHFNSASWPASHYGQSGTNFGTSPNHPDFQSSASDVVLPRTAAGHKRKLEALRPPQIEKKPGPPTAPSVPNFGTSLLLQQTRTTDPSGRTEKDRGSLQRKVNVLGLTPGDDDHNYTSSEAEAEEDDVDVDEEAMFAEMGTKLSFEHNGTVVSLSTPAEVAQWRNERRKNFPTRARMSVKLDEKRRIGELRKTLLVDAVTILQNKGRDAHEVAQSDPTPLSRSSENISKVETANVDHPNHRPAARGAQGSKPEPRITNMTETSELGIVDSDAVLNPTTESQTIDTHNTSKTMEAPSSKLNVRSRESIPASEAAESHRSDSDDGPPEEASSKQTITTSTTIGRLQPCRFFLARGRCRDGEGCRFSHDPLPNSLRQITRESQIKDRASVHDRPPPVPAPVFGRRGIHQALIEQEESDQNKLALRLIKHLGATGFFNC